MADTTQRHSLLYRVVGAAQTVTDNTKVTRSLQVLTRVTSQLQAGMMGMGGLAIGFAGAMVALGLGLRRTVSAYTEYTEAQARMRTVLALSGNDYRLHARLAGDLAEQVGGRLGYSLTEANDAMTRLLETGLGTHASMRVFESGMRLARVSEMDTATATQFLVDSYQMFNREMVDATGNSRYEIREFADLLAGRLSIAAAMSSTSIEQLQQSFRYAGTEMSALGYTSTEVMSALAGLSTVGIRGTTAGTRMRQMIAQLADPANRVRERIDQLTGSTGSWQRILYNEAGNRRGLPDMMSQVMQLFARLPTEAARSELAFALFGTRAFAAGISIATFNEAARKMLEVNEELGNDSMVRRRLYDAERQRMMSFGMQMTQLKEGATDLAIAFGEILFGAMDRSGQGFGTTIRQIARGIRLLGQDGGETSEEFRRLSPQVQNTARNMRELFRNLASLLRSLARLAVWMANFTQEHPYVVAGILAMRYAFGGMVPAVGAVIRAVLWMGRTIATQCALGVARLQTMSMTSAATTVAFGLMGVAVVNALVPALRDGLLGVMGLSGGLDELRQGGTAAWLEQNIPLVGNLAAAWVDVYNGLRLAIQAHDEMVERRRATEEGVTRAGAEARVNARMANIGGQQRFANASQEEIQRRAIGLEQNESRMRLAALLWSEEIRGREAVTEHLANAGLQGQDLTNAIAEIVRIQQQQGSALEQEANGLVAPGGPFGILGRDMTGAARDATTQLVQFSQMLEELNNGESVPGESGGAEVPVAEDAYVRRGGVMGVSSGDVIVSARHLADAITASRGALAAPAVAMASGVTTGSSTVSSGEGGEFTITVPVVVDGREIARAQGRAQIRQLERGGGRLPPGQRRSLRETGFNRVV